MIGLALVGLLVGPHSVSPSDTIVLGSMIMGNTDFTGSDAVISAVRVPRVLVALLVGAGLGVAGAAMQGVFRNPLAEPGITGVSSGAAAAAVILIVTGVASAHWLVLPLGAFLGALAAVIIVHTCGALTGSTSSLLLVGSRSTLSSEPSSTPWWRMRATLKMRGRPCSGSTGAWLVAP